ncbi:MAG TPA: hypothetical protein VI728_14095, partial [Syntrophales bacterium]|nr:hypothetical protein [Syntrophales bacterium]
MANGFHGYRFLVDAKNSRQYSIPYVNGHPQQPIHVFAEDDRQGGFKPNEVIFAFDDVFEFASTAEGEIMSTTAFQINVDNAAKPTALSRVGVEYRVTVEGNALGNPVVRYEMTEKSVQALKDLEFDPGFPRSFSKILKPGEFRLDGNRMEINLNNLPFPPHHNGG